MNFSIEVACLSQFWVVFFVCAIAGKMLNFLPQWWFAGLEDVPVGRFMGSSEYAVRVMGLVSSETWQIRGTIWISVPTLKWAGSRPSFCLWFTSMVMSWPCDETQVWQVDGWRVDCVGEMTVKPVDYVTSWLVAKLRTGKSHSAQREQAITDSLY